jgi:nicotinamide mononucleotide adenylyltransferase
MRIKGNDNRRQLPLARSFHDPPQQLNMGKVHAVKVADSDDTAPWWRRYLGNLTDDFHNGSSNQPSANSTLAVAARDHRVCLPLQSTTVAAG